MNKLFTKLAKLTLGLAMACSVGVAIGAGRKGAKSVSGAAGDKVSFVYTTSANKKLSTTYGANTLADDSISGLSVSCTTAKTKGSGVIQNTYNTSYGGQQMTTNANRDTTVTFTFGDPWSGTHATYKEYTQINSVTFTAVAGSSTTYNVTCTIDGVAATGDNSGFSATKTTTTFTPASGHNKGVIVITVTYSSGSKGWYFDNLGINAEVPAGSKTLSSIAVKTAPTKVSYFEGQTFDPTGLVITATYSDSSTADFDYANHSGDFTFTPSISTALTSSIASISIGYKGATCSQSITVNADSLNTVSLSGTMSSLTYTTVDSWSTAGLIVTANYAAQGNVDVTSGSSFNFYADSAMTKEVATPNDLGVGNNQKIYVKATYSGVSNATGYSQTVSVTKAPSVQNAVFDLTAVSANNDDATVTDDEVVITKGVSTVTVARGGSGNTKVSNYIGGSGAYVHTRWYKGNTITFESDGNVIKEIVVVGESGTNGPTGKMATLSSWTGASSLDSTSVSGQVTVTASANVTSLSYTLSGTVRLTGATIYYYAADVAAESITINGEASSTVSITPYQETKLNASVLPLNASDRTFEWSLSPSGDDAIITIDENGNVAPIAGKYGPTVVTATSHDGGYTATCTVTVEHVSYYQAVYYPASTSSVTTSGTLPDGESHTFSCGNFQTGYAQLTTNAPTATLTLSGYNGQKVRTVLLKMHSNQSAGTGELSIVAGSTTVASISSAAFSDESWNGEYTTEWVLIEPAFTAYDVQASEDVVITVSASVNSLFLSEVRVQYEPSEVDTTAVDFAQMILDDINCNAQGTSAPSSSDWLIIKGFWEDGTTITAAGKQTLLDAEAVEHESPSTNEEIIQAGMAKYDYIIGKYNKGLGLTTEYPDFIDRNPSPIGGSAINLFPINGNNTNTIAIIVIISVVSMTAIGGYFFLRNRKENQ